MAVPRAEVKLQLKCVAAVGAFSGPEWSPQNGAVDLLDSIDLFGDSEWALITSTSDQSAQWFHDWVWNDENGDPDFYKRHNWHVVGISGHNWHQRTGSPPGDNLQLLVQFIPAPNNSPSGETLLPAPAGDFAVVSKRWNYSDLSTIGAQDFFGIRNNALPVGDAKTDHIFSVRGNLNVTGKNFNNIHWVYMTAHVYPAQQMFT